MDSNGYSDLLHMSISLRIPPFKSIHIHARHNLDEYLWSLPASCFVGDDLVLKKLPYQRFAMELTIPYDHIFWKEEFSEKLWSSYCNGKELDWEVTPQFVIRLQNEAFEHLHKVLQAHILKVVVGKLQLHHIILTAD